MTRTQFIIDPALDLVIDREIAVPVDLVWKAWTTPRHLMEWFVPKPWTIVSAELDVRPGGAFNTTMRSPEGKEFPNLGCYLEVHPNERLVFTDTLLPGYRPSPKPFFTAVLELSPAGANTRYRAIAIHGDEAARKSHEEMGFHNGWNTVVDQMVDYIRRW